MKSARGARPTVLMAPLRSRNVFASSLGSERCKIHMARILEGSPGEYKARPWRDSAAKTDLTEWREIVNTVETATEPSKAAVQAPAPDLEAIKEKQRATWASGDYGTIGTTLQIVGETLCEAVDLRAGSRCSTLRPAMATRRWQRRAASAM